MARTKKGRAVSGWLIIDKPAGITSTAVVNKVKWAFQAQKAGHAGTLDPAATGVLAVALGEATKTVPYITDALKCYRFVVRLGSATNTDDAEGRVIATSDTRPTDAAIADALAAFRGDIMQVPPQFSAVGSMFTLIACTTSGHSKTRCLRKRTSQVCSIPRRRGRQRHRRAGHKWAKPHRSHRRRPSRRRRKPHSSQSERSLCHLMATRGRRLVRASGRQPRSART